MSIKIPEPNSKRSQWPWAGELKDRPSVDISDQELPKVTIVTPSFNQAAFLEQTIRSVLLQDYPNLEYIIIDGGSTDGSVEIIRKYEPWLTYWSSEPDSGQSNAINKGLTRATGDVIGWLNSDDIYMPDAISNAVNLLNANPDTLMIYGDFGKLNGAETRWERSREFNLGSFIAERYICQPASFQRREAADLAGPLDEKYDYVMDIEWWLRIAAIREPAYVPITLASFREWKGSKTTKPPYSAFYGELLRATEGFFERLGASDPRSHLRSGILAELHVQLASALFGEQQYESGGNVLSEAARNDFDVFWRLSEHTFDRLLFTARGTSRLRLKGAEEALRIAIRPLNHRLSSSRMNDLENELLAKLRILKGGQLGPPDEVKSGRNSIPRLLLKDTRWIWRQRGWAGRTALGPNISRLAWGSG